MGYRWGLAWQTLPHSGEVCWGPAGPPTLSRMGWTLNSSSTSAHPSVHHVPHQEQPPGSPGGGGCPAVQGSHRTSSQRVLSGDLHLAVPGAEEDRRSTSGHRFVHAEPAHGVPHFKMETQGSIKAAIRSQEWTISIDIRDAYLHVTMHKAVRKYLHFVVNKRVHLSLLWIGHFTSGGHKAAASSRSSVKEVRYQGVSQMDQQLREVRPNTQPGLPVHRDAVRHSTVHSGGPVEDASQSPACSPTLDDQPCHHSPRSAQIAGHGGVYDNTGPTWKTLSSSPMVGRHSLVPEDRELLRQDHSSSVGTVRGGLVGISSSPRHQGNGSHSLYGCVQLGLGSPVRLTLNTGTVVSISKIVSHQRSGDAGHHQRRESLPSSSEIPGGALDVWQCSDTGLHQEWGGNSILHSHAADVTLAEVVRS